MKILELTGFSSGACGVWNRVKEESILLSKKGHEVRVFSSNLVKGNTEKAKSFEKIGKVSIQRFSAIKPGHPPIRFVPGGEGYMFWNFSKAMEEAMKFKPDAIICHTYRQNHTLFGLRLAKKLGIKVFLVTHAPFVEKHKTRSFLAALSTEFYDYFIGKRTINKFDKIMPITKWELAYLKKLGVKHNKLNYLPNGIPKEFFKQKKIKENSNKILFLGRISPIKNIEALINAMSLLKEKAQLEIVGPAEGDYLRKLKKLINEKGLQNKIKFSKPIYDLKSKIRKIDSAKVFVLPSIREAMPQALIEAMAREKIVVSSDNPGSKELISKSKNGYLFKLKDKADLAKKLDLALKGNKKLGKEARKSVERFSWDKIILRLEKLIKK